MPSPDEIYGHIYILKLDSSIKFVAITNQMGRQVGTAYRAGLELILTKEEIDSYMTKTVLQMKTAEDFESKLGNVIYTLIFYDKLKRVMVPLKHPDFSVFMASLDTSASHDDIIMNKILPEVQKSTRNMPSLA
jgi:hypothetical protein